MPDIKKNEYFYGNMEDKRFLAKLLDKIKVLHKSHQIQTTDFIDPSLQSITDQFLEGQLGINWDFFGGVIQAERQRVVLAPSYREINETDASIQLIFCKGDFSRVEGAKINHRNYLGALLATGIKREKIGDLWVIPEGCVVAVDQDLAGYLIQQIIRIKGVTLNLSFMELGTFTPPLQQTKIIETTVPSLRLDAVAASGFSTSRTKIVNEINGGKIKVNWQEVMRIDYILKEGDVLSGRGKGRVILQKVEGVSKKGRIKITLEKLL